MAFENAAEGQGTNRIISVISFTRRGFELSLRVRAALKRSGQKRTILYTKKDSVALEFEEAVLVKEKFGRNLHENTFCSFTENVMQE